MQRTLVLMTPLLLAVTGCSSSQPDVDRWEYTGGPFAQNVSAVLVDEKLPSTVYAGLTNGEVYLSHDNGTTWGRIGEMQGRAAIRRFAQDTDMPERIYAATDAGVSVSINRGKNWNQLLLPVESACSVIAIDPWKTNVVYAGTTLKGIFKSTDAGVTWRTAADSASAPYLSKGVRDIVVDIAKPDIVIAAIDGTGIVRSTNAGATWTRLTEEFSSGGSAATHVAVGSASSETIVYATNSGNIVKSTNGGASWSPTRYGEEFDAIRSLLAPASRPGTIFAGTGNGVLTSTDFGTTWSNNRDNLPDLPTWLAAAERGGNGAIFAFGPGIGLQRSTDGGFVWQQAGEKLGGASVKQLLTDRSGEHVFASVGSTLLRYNAQKVSWEPAGMGILGSDITSFAFDSEFPATLYATTGVSVFKTTNGGEQWKPAARKLRTSPVFLDTHPTYRTRIFASGEQGLFISTDRGETWMQTRPFDTKFRVRSFSFQPNNAGLMFGIVQGGATISTENGGFLWEAGRFGLPGEDLTAITLDDQDLRTIYAWTMKGEGFRSINKGMEWNRYAPPWRAMDSVTITVDRYLPSDVLALVNGREVYYSRSGGGTWFLLGDFPLPAEVSSLHWNGATSMLYAATTDQGVFRLSLDALLKHRFGE